MEWVNKSSNVENVKTHDPTEVLNQIISNYLQKIAAWMAYDLSAKNVLERICILIFVKDRKMLIISGEPMTKTVLKNTMGSYSFLLFGSFLDSRVYCKPLSCD